MKDLFIRFSLQCVKSELLIWYIFLDGTADEIVDRTLYNLSM